MTADSFAFQLPSDGEPLTLESAVYQAIGAASVCWENMSGTGIFDDTRARAIAEALLEQIRLEQPLILTSEERDRVTGWFVKLGEPPTEILPEDRALFQRLEGAEPAGQGGFAEMLEIQTSFIETCREASIDVEVSTMRDGTVLTTRTGLFADRHDREERALQDADDEDDEQ